MKHGMSKMNRALMAEWDAGFSAGWKAGQKALSAAHMGTTTTGGVGSQEKIEKEILTSANLMCQILAERRPWNKPIKVLPGRVGMGKRDRP